VTLLCLLAGCDGIWDLEHVERADASQLPPDLAAWFPMETAADGEVVDVAGPHEGVCLSGECPVMDRGVVDNALVFDGVTQVVNAPSSTALDVMSSFTVAFWARMDGDPSSTACAVNKLFLGSETDNAWQFCAYAGTWYFYASPIEAVGPPIAIGKWQHLAATWDQQTGELRFYQNGFVVGQPVIGTLNFDDGRLVIGADVDAGRTLVHFPGAIDELKIFTRALTAAEMLDLAVGL
jgi:hypothetical protein